MPAPWLAVLPERMELETVRVPLAPLKMLPPSSGAELLDRVELETDRMPALLKAAPLPVVKFAPETVTPEMERLPSEAMVKIRKFRDVLLGLVGSLPLMVRVEAPGPVMVRVPAVPPVTIAVLALTMVGNADPSVMVFTPVKLKLI